MFEVLESIPINHDPINSIMLQYEHLLITSMPIMKEEKKQGMFTNMMAKMKWHTKLTL